jgi:hypothetical protein
MLGGKISRNSNEKIANKKPCHCEKGTDEATANYARPSCIVRDCHAALPMTSYISD